MEEGKGVKAGGDSAGQPVSVRVLPPSSVTSTTQFTFFLLKMGKGRINKTTSLSMTPLSFWITVHRDFFKAGIRSQRRELVWPWDKSRIKNSQWRKLFVENRKPLQLQLSREQRTTVLNNLNSKTFEIE
jgi:hypothetical protein